MRYKIGSLLVLILIFAIAVFSQDTEPKVKKYSVQDYANLVSKAKGGDTSVDFTAMRLAYTETKDYSYHGPEKEEREKFYKPFGSKNYKEALKQVEKYLDSNYVDANAHYVAYTSAKEMKDETKAEFYKAILLGLLNSIKNGNNGLSAKTPFKVISIDEEYTLMRFLGLKFSSQSLQNDDGHKFDVFEAVDSKTNEKLKIYFEIDIVWSGRNETVFGEIAGSI